MKVLKTFFYQHLNHEEDWVEIKIKWLKLVFLWLKHSVLLYIYPVSIIYSVSKHYIWEQADNKERLFSTNANITMS